jgi:N-acyl-L-homoserine lactone synthetase
MAPGCERIRDAARDFDVAVADTEEKLEAAFRLRHQVYCVERGFEPGDGAIETDRFDVRSMHAILTQRSTGRVVGTVRVVGPSLRGLDADLPMQRVCPSDLFRMLPMGSTGEVSRFSISKDLRDAACAGNAMLRLGLMRGIVQVSSAMNLTHWCAVMEHTLLRLLRVSAIHFQSLGPAIEHRGLRQPSWGSIDVVLGRMRRERPAVWDYITDGGALWQVHEEAEAVFA